MKYKDIYTVGCFDHFHKGHSILLNKMKEHGTKLIVGIHDDASIEKLKKLSPDEHDDIYKRMENVKMIADVVYIIPDTDPTECLRNIISKTANEKNSCYIRGNDMPNFPGRDLVETIMPIIFLPYTQGISATMLRRLDKEQKEQKEHAGQCSNMEGSNLLSTICVLVFLVLILMGILKGRV